MPSAGECDNENRAGYNEYVFECRQQALFWHNIWRANGSPRHGVIADIRRNTRAGYHYTLRYIDRNKNRLQADKVKDIESQIRSSCEGDACHSGHSITLESVKEAVLTLKSGENDGTCTSSCTSDHIISGTERLYLNMALLFTCMLKHGFVPK